MPRHLLSPGRSRTPVRGRLVLVLIATGLVGCNGSATQPGSIDITASKNAAAAKGASDSGRGRPGAPAKAKPGTPPSKAMRR